MKTAPLDRPDRLTLAYRGPDGNSCIVDQALRWMPDGTWSILFVTGGPGEPHPANYIAQVRSEDEGASWSAPETVLRLPDRACLLTEVTVQEANVTVYGSAHRGRFEDWKCFTLTSADSGHTWDGPVPFAPAPRRAFVRNLYVATWGTWYLPVQTYDHVVDPSASPLADGSFQTGGNYVLRSLDQGRTWEPSNTIGPLHGWNENNLVELSDGRLVMLVRAATDAPCLRRSESLDRGATWSTWQHTDIPNPGSKFRLFRLPDGRIVLLHNPCPIPGQRHPLALWVSADDMGSWGYRRIITDFPGRLSYPDGVVRSDGRYVDFAFDYNRHDLVAVSARLPALEAMKLQATAGSGAPQS